MRTAYAVAVCLFLASSVFGGTVTSIDPQKILVSSGEYFMTFNGSSLGGPVKYDGPAGTFELETNADFIGSVVAWVPLEIVNTPGTYEVTVGDSNTVKFEVFKTGKPLLQLHLLENLAVLAKSRLGSVIDYEVTATGPDPDSITIKCDPKAGSTFPFGQSKIKCIAYDNLDNRDEGMIDVTVWDGVAPKLSIPKGFEVPAEDERGTMVKWEASAIDDIDGALEVTCFPKSESIFPPGRTKVACEATDLSLNPAGGTFDVFVQPRDIGKLELKVPDKVVEAAEIPEGANVEYEVIAYGSADPDPVVQCNPASGAFFALGRTKVYCTAYDDFDQRAEAGFEVEVVERLELKFADVTAEVTSPSGTPVAWEATAENWTNTIRCTPESGSLFDLGATTVECTSTDERGRKAGGTFKVNVADTIAPHISQLRAIPGPASGGLVPVQVAVEATDAGDAMPRCSVSALTADGGAFDWRLRGDLEVEVRAEAKRPFRITVSCVDSSGNRSMESVGVALGGARMRMVN